MMPVLLYLTFLQKDVKCGHWSQPSYNKGRQSLPSCHTRSTRVRVETEEGLNTRSKGTDGSGQMWDVSLVVQKNRGFVITVANHGNKSCVTLENEFGVSGSGDSCRLWQLDCVLRGKRKFLHASTKCNGNNLNGGAHVCLEAHQHCWWS